jgi:hypothetical protein
MIDGLMDANLDGVFSTTAFSYFPTNYRSIEESFVSSHYIEQGRKEGRIDAACQRCMAHAAGCGGGCLPTE